MFYISICKRVECGKFLNQLRKVRKQFQKGDISTANFPQTEMICSSRRRRKIRNNRKLLRKLRIKIKRKKNSFEKRIEQEKQEEEADAETVGNPMVKRKHKGCLTKRI